MNKLKFVGTQSSYWVKAANKDISGAVVIPATYDGRPTVLNDFRDCSQITSITILKGMNNITSITIPANVKKINSRAFESCNNLTSVTFQGANTKIDPSSFPGDLQTKYKAGAREPTRGLPGATLGQSKAAAALCPTCGKPL